LDNYLVIFFLTRCPVLTPALLTQKQSLISIAMTALPQRSRGKISTTQYQLTLLMSLYGYCL
jgi:hypothetical protein